MNLSQPLAQGLTELGLQLGTAAHARLGDYLGLIQKWNRVYNLTAVREPRKMLAHHLFDCLAVAPRVAAENVLDAGSGAGLPGIPLAIARPSMHVTLLDSSHKKAAFLKQAVIELALDNVSVVCERVEAWDTPQRFDLVVSRALTDLPEFIRLAGRLVAPAGALAAMKGIYPYEEIAQVPAGWRVSEATALKVPGLRAERHWVRVERAGRTEEGGP